MHAQWTHAHLDAILHTVMQLMDLLIIASAACISRLLFQYLTDKIVSSIKQIGFFWNYNTNAETEVTFELEAMSL